MFQSHAFKKRLRKLDNGGPAAPAEQREAEIREAFLSALPGLPEPMQAELFDFFSRKYRAEPDVYTVDDAFFLGEVIDLFAGDYDEQADPLDSEDWDFLKDIIDENAVELDMQLVNYVMKLVVDKGVL
jgi:hypothetical protein